LLGDDVLASDEGVEMGMGFDASRRFGASADEIFSTRSAASIADRTTGGFEGA